MYTIIDWLKGFENLPSVTVNSEQSVEGICKKSLGGRFLYAGVKINISPSDNLIFEIDISKDKLEILENEKLMNSIFQGVLDSMLIRPLTSITNFKCIIQDIDYHEIDSTKKAFRLAGRNAAENFLKNEKFNGI